MSCVQLFISNAFVISLDTPFGYLSMRALTSCVSAVLVCIFFGIFDVTRPHHGLDTLFREKKYFGVFVNPRAQLSPYQILFENWSSHLNVNYEATNI